MRNIKRVISMVLAVCMLLSVLPLSAFAVSISSKPANGTTAGQPFLAGTGGSTNFRIPGIVTLDNGTLIATSDARWNGTADAGGLDTIVSVSTDNGANWTYTFANYLGDNGDTWINTSSCIIDPAIGTDGETAYMIADLFPAGFAINSARYPAQDGSTGFDADGNLLLRSDEENGITFGSNTYASDAAGATYGYYLKDGKIWTSAGAEVEGYSVDAYFNIEGPGVNTNLFFSDSPYKPFPTDYLYMTTSTDGLNWSAPKLLNLKAADEQTLLVGPGNGTYNAVTGHMVFTAYEYDWGTQNTALIWRDTEGQWYRSENVSPNNWTSEATSVVLDDGTVRVFYRDGFSVLRYTDMTWDEESHNYVRVVGATEVTTEAAKRSNNQLTSIKYSKQIDGKDVILVACASSADARSNGYLYVFLVDDDNSMELAYSYDIIPGKIEGYAYNCISEMADGNIALLYEGDNPATNASAEIIFTTIDMDDVTTFENDARLNFIDVDLYVGDTHTFKDSTGNYSAVSEYDTAVVKVTADGTTATVPAASGIASGTPVALTDAMYTLTAVSGGWNLSHVLSDGTTVYVDAHGGSGNYGYPNRETASVLTLVNSSYTTGSIIIKDDTGSLHLHKEQATPYWNQCSNPCGYRHDLMFFRLAESGETESEVFAGFVQVTDVAALEDGEAYLIAAASDAGDYYILNPALGGASRNSNDHLAKVTGALEISSTTVTIEALAAGSTQVQVGSNVYNITVLPANYDPISIPAAENVYQGPAVTITEKPANGTTQGQPFPTGTGGSGNFRIPGIVTLNDGTVIATTDARWNHTGDGAGLDTLVSVTKDNGANWTYTFANYLGDNGNTKNNLSTSIIDPAIGTNGETAYLIADLFPAGIALNTSRYAPVAGENGFDANGNLLLRDLAGDTIVIGQNGYNTMAAAREYNYYLDLGTYQICTANGTVCAGFTVDPWFNITYTDAAGTTHQTNLFFADSPFQPYPTDYLYLKTSEDGLNWSVPKLLNLQEENEQTLLIGPGNGTSEPNTGRMVFTAYEYTNGTQYTSLIWEDSDGTWYRTEDATVGSWSSEATVVALDDGTLRVFYRDGYSNLRYTDFIWSDTENNYVRDDNVTEVSTSAAKRNNNQLTSIVYSTQIDGKDAILVACAANPNTRADGHLYVFLVNDDKTMELAYDYDIVPNSTEYYAYNCITELNDGTIGLVYESDDGGNGSGKIRYEILDMFDVTVRDNDVRLSFVDVTVLTGESVTVTDGTGNYAEADTSELDENVATVEIDATSMVTISGQLGNDASYSGALIDLADCLYTFTQNENGYWVINNGDIYLNTNGNTGYPHGTASCTFTIGAGKEAGTFYIRSTTDSNAKGDANYLYFDRAARNWNRVNNLNNNSTWMTNCSMSLFRAADGEGSGEIPGYDRVTSLNDITAGRYLIGACANDGNWYVAYPSTVETTRYNQIAKVGDSTTISTTTITFTGAGEGYSEVVIGTTVYHVTVKEFITEEVSVAVGGSATINTTYTGELTGLDTAYATAELADGTLTITGVYPGTAHVDLGRTRYNITVNGNVVKLDLTEKETASYVVSGTNVDMTQPDADVATVTFGTDWGAQLGSAQSTYAGAYASLDKLLYTFTDNGNGTWTVSSTTADGTTVYLQPYSATNGYPNVTTPVAVTLSNGYTDNSVYLYGNGGYLYFYRNDRLYFDRVTTTSGFESAISFLLYRPAAEGETSSTEIPGYVLVEGADAVTEGKYLIVAEYNGEYYMVYPTTSTAHRSVQAAHLVGDATTLNITGESADETSFRVESTVYEITVSHNYESGFCTACGRGTAQNTATGEEYGTVAEALAAAKSGETVTLMTDCEESRVLVTPGVTLDLNGWTLTADYVVGFNTSNVVDNSTANTGILVVESTANVVLTNTNAQLPIWNGEGYIFAEVLGFNELTNTDENGNTEYIFQPLFEEVAHQYLADGASNHELKVAVRMTWSIDTGTAYQDFVYKDAQVINVTNSYNSETGKYGRAYRIVLTEADHYDFTLNVVLISTTGAEIVPEG